MILERLYLIAVTSIVVMSSALSWIPANPKETPSKTTEEYWAETGMDTSAVEELIDTESCRSSQRYFLACVNAVGTVGTRLGYQLDGNGQWQAHLLDASVTTEKEFLAPWTQTYLQLQKERGAIDFLSAWRELLGRNARENQRAYFTGLAMNGFLSVFRDPHTYLLPERYYREVMTKNNSTLSSLGLVFGRDGANYFLRKVLDGSSSQQAGLRRGDVVVSINGLELNSAPPQRLSELLRHAENAEFDFKIQRGTKISMVHVKRTNVKFPSVTWKKIDSLRPVGVITVNRFVRGGCAEMKKAMIEMRDEGLRGLLVDLRDNSGGQMEEAACMVSLFVGPEKAAFRLRYLDPAREPEVYFGQEERVWFRKVAVLINAGSASASEILAGSLRDYNAAILVGEKSFGKGSFQEGETWSRNPKVFLFQTRGFYYLPSGYSPQMHGITPDIAVKYRAGLNLREEDQFVNPLYSPQINTEWERPAFQMGPCLASEEVKFDDRQMATAHSALFCKSSFAEGGSLHAQNR